MTQEEKSKAYDEALERAKQFITKELYAECNGNLVEYIFPELKESEDERIRKEFYKDIRIFIPNEKANKYIAWLEKQGHMLNAAKVIEWLKHRELSCDDVVTTVIPDDSPTSVRHKVKLLSDEFIKQFKKDFGL